MQLSMFEGLHGNRRLLMSAGEITVLPSNIPLAAVEMYLSPSAKVSSYSQRLLDIHKSCGSTPAQRLGIPDLMSILSFPRLGSNISTTIRQYKLAITSILVAERSGLPADSIHVPNERGILCLPNTLFDHRVPLFARALSGVSDSFFLHPAFQDYVDDIGGFKSTLSFANFLHCAMISSPRLAFIDQVTDAIDRDTLLSLSSVLFETYSEVMPNEIRTVTMRWMTLQNLTFIRRQDVRRHGASYDIQPHLVPLPTILPPSKILRAHLEPIAWTQRGMFYDPPSEHLIAVNPTLGIPSVQEVVRLSYNVVTRSLV